MIAHVVVETGALWYPFVALLVPAFLIVVLTRYDAIRHARAQSIETAPECPTPS